MSCAYGCMSVLVSCYCCLCFGGGVAGSHRIYHPSHLQPLWHTLHFFEVKPKNKLSTGWKSIHIEMCTCYASECVFEDVKLLFVLESLPRRHSSALVWEFSSRKPPPQLGLPRPLLLLISASCLTLPFLLDQHRQHWHGLWRKQCTTSCRFHHLFDTLHFSSAVSSFQMRGDGSVFTESTKLHLALIKGSKCFCIDYFSADVIHHTHWSLFM